MAVRFPTLKTVSRFGARHWKWFAVGLCAAVVFVGLRLALPMVFRALVRPWLRGGDPVSMWGLDPAVLCGGAIALLLIGTGAADYLVRVAFARFAIRTVDDMRSEAVRSLAPATVTTARQQSDVVTRLVSDCSRAKSGIKGFLIHVVGNALLFAGVSLIVALLNPVMGAMFAAACLVVAAYTAITARAIRRKSTRARKREAALVHGIAEQLSGREGALVASTKLSKANITKAQARATWVAYAAFGFALAGAVVYGGSAVHHGEMPAENMVVFFLYAQLLRAPLVKLARQGARAGKIAASVHRIKALHAAPASPAAQRTAMGIPAENI